MAFWTTTPPGSIALLFSLHFAGIFFFCCCNFTKLLLIKNLKRGVVAVLLACCAEHCYVIIRGLSKYK